MTASKTPGVVLQGQDVPRSRDRYRVLTARRSGRRWYLYWLLVGPGILAMLGENDGPSMISYAATGSTYGLGFFLPFIVVCFAMAVVCQEMCMRVGAVTHRGYAELVLQRYGRAWVWSAAGDLMFTNVVTLIAEFASIRAGLAYFHVQAGMSFGLGLALVLVSLSGRTYRRWERVVLGLALFNGLFLVAAVLVKPNIARVGHSLITFSPFPSGNFNILLLLLASTVGATVTPWMIFFQQSASADKGMTSADIRYGRVDTVLGAILAAAFGGGALVAGAALAPRGGSSISVLSGAGFPAALRSVSGGLVGTTFALGLIEAGAVAVLTISASTAYAVAECVGSSHSFNMSPRRGLLFYGCDITVAAVAGAIVLIPGVPLLKIVLNVNVLATVLSPVVLLFVLMLANDKELMGERANKRSANVLVILVVGLIWLCGSAYGIDSFLLSAHFIGSH
jgi:Mn2+/Fe2+ NRAMP family transporter